MTEAPIKFLSFPGKIHLIKSDLELHAVSEALLAAKQFGFDTETRPSFKKGEVYPVAILQLATNTDAYIIRLKHLTNFEVLKNIFENTNVLKVGAAIRDDLKLLQKKFPFTPQGFIELQTVAKTKNLKNIGLKGMTEEVLHAALNKGPKTTNWDAQDLTDRQILYAATDAWVGLKIYQKLESIEDSSAC
jgi:ribonuclease D